MQCSYEVVHMLYILASKEYFVIVDKVLRGGQKSHGSNESGVEAASWTGFLLPSYILSMPPLGS